MYYTASLGSCANGTAAPTYRRRSTSPTARLGTSSSCTSLDRVDDTCHREAAARDGRRSVGDRRGADGGTPVAPSRDTRGVSVAPGCRVGPGVAGRPGAHWWDVHLGRGLQARTGW